MLKQYHDIKSRHKDAILFFRLGDFYEMFFEDAREASSLLDLVLTSRGTDASGKVPMCGVPYHSSDKYIAKLIKAGKKVAICEQVEDPALAKGLVKRDVIRIISAGTYLDESIDSRYLVAICPGKTFGIAFIDNSGGAKFLIPSTVETKTTEKWADGKEYPAHHVEISSASHPFYTNQEKIIDTAGRVEKFKTRQSKAKANK